MLSTTKISAVKLDNLYQVKINFDNQDLLHFHKFDSLFDAVSLAHKVISINQINLDYWKSLDTNDEIIDKFLLKSNKQNSFKFKAHLWNGLDTFCTMWSSGGLGPNYDLFNKNFGKEICVMCLHNSKN